MALTATKLAVDGAYVITFPRFSDNRGYLQELYNQDKYPAEVAKHFPIKQATYSTNCKNVIRGLHVSPYAKLLTCITGEVYDVVVDCRPESPTYLKWSAVILTDENCKQILVPPHCGHGYYAMTEGATVIYGQSDTFKPGIDWGFNPFDPSANVFWPIPTGVTPVVSQKDQDAAHLTVGKRLTTPRKRVLVIGASGQVGGAVCDVFKKYEAEYQVYGTTQTTDINNYIPFDMQKAAGDESYVRDVFTVCRPNVIVICAAYNYVDQCETDTDTGKAINVDALKVMGKVSQEIGAKVVHYCTDYIFTDSTPTPDKKIVLTEDSPTEPANTYGKLKLEGEQAIAALPGSIVLRVARVFGPELHGKNFAYRTISCLTEKKPLYCLHSEISCATYNRDIANATVELIRKGSSGIFHCVGPEPLSKYEWAMQIAKFFNLNTETVVGLEKLDKGAPRPKYVPMNTEKLRKELPDLKLHTLQEAFLDWQVNPSGKPIDWTNFTKKGV